MNEDDRRLLLAFVLSLLVFLAYQLYVTTKYPPVSRPAAPAMTDAGPETPSTASAPQSPLPLLQDSSFSRDMAREETTVLQGNGIEITATSRGAGIRQIRLTGIPRAPHKDFRDVILIDEDFPDPYGFRLPGESIARIFRRRSVSDGQAAYELDVPADSSGRAGLHVERTLSLSQTRYEISVQTKIRNLTDRQIQYGSDSATALSLTIAPFPKKLGKNALDIHEMYVKLGDQIVHRQEHQPGFFDRFFGKSKTAADLHEETLDGILRWLSTGDRYFTVTTIPDSPLARARLAMEGPSLRAEAQYGYESLGPGREKVFEEKIYAGPKIPDLLRRYSADLQEIMNFGWFEWLGFWMLRLMNIFYKIIPNYGIAIILMTGVVRLVLYPLTYKSYVSMSKLKELSPKMKALQEKYKDNREKLNKELMEMYKEHKVNPAGGCLPILLQIPVFIAFYRMLQYSIELRGAPFCLWIMDLSEKDPYFVLPVLMGVSMLIQQKMTPSPDPNQANIGMVMTVVFTFVFLTFPSGLVLYWLVSNILGITQQKMIERKLKPSSAVS